MSFSANIEKAVQKVTSLCRIRPRIRKTGWTANGTYPASVYEIDWPESTVVGIYLNAGDSATEQSSLSDCNSTQYSWYYDRSLQKLYFNPSGSDNPNTGITVIEFDWLIASETLSWYRNPINTASGDAIWSGGLVKPAIPQQGSSDIAFGFLPIQNTSIQIELTDDLILEYAHSFSLNKAPIKIWQCVGDLETGNISEVFIGSCANYSIQNAVISIEVSDALRELEEVVQIKTFNYTDFPQLDPDALGKNIRQVYGMIKNFQPTNIDFDSSNTPTGNKEWVICEGDVADFADYESLIDHLSGSNTATTTKVASVFGLVSETKMGALNTGDQIVIYDNGVPKYTYVVSVDSGTNIITHGNIGARSPVVTDTVERSFVGAVWITTKTTFPNVTSTVYLKYKDDFDVQNFANGTVGITLVDSFDLQNSQLYCRVYGPKTLPKKLDDTTDFGAVSEFGNSFSNPVTIIWDILRNKLRYFDQNFLLDEVEWNDLATNFDRPVGICVPDTISDAATTWKEVIQRLLQTELLKIHNKIDSGLVKLMISQTKPMSLSGPSPSSNDLRDASFDYSYNDLYQFTNIYLNEGEGTNSDQDYLVPTVIQSEIDNAKYLHRSGKQFDFDTLFQFEEDAQIIADRIGFIFGERRGTMNLFLPLEYTLKNIDDGFTLSTDYLPGFALNGSINSRDYVILQHAKSPNGVTFVLDDQKGIEDNAGDW